MNKMKKKVLVCGSTGFIGRNIAETLAEMNEFDVTGTYFTSPPLTHPNIHSVYADLRDIHYVKEIMRNKDIIIQAAATTSGSKDIVTKPYIHVTDNAVMNSLIFRVAYDFNISHVIFFSCTVMYQSSENPIAESDFNASEDIHEKYFGIGWTKVYLEKICEFYSRLNQNKYTVIRHSNIYGPHDKYDLEHSHVFGATITKIMTSRNGKIDVWGDGSEKRDLLYISDLVYFVLLAIYKQKSTFELVNVGSGQFITVKELVLKIIQCSGKQIAVSYDLTRPNIPISIRLDISKAYRLFNWKPSIPLMDGIKKTLDWYTKENQYFKENYV